MKVSGWAGGEGSSHGVPSLKSCSLAPSLTSARNSHLCGPGIDFTCLLPRSAWQCCRLAEGELPGAVGIPALWAGGSESWPLTLLTRIVILMIARLLMVVMLMVVVMGMTTVMG